MAREAKSCQLFFSSIELQFWVLFGRSEFNESHDRSSLWPPRPRSRRAEQCLCQPRLPGRWPRPADVRVGTPVPLPLAPLALPAGSSAPTTREHSVVFTTQRSGGFPVGPAATLSTNWCARRRSVGACVHQGGGGVGGPWCTAGAQPRSACRRASSRMARCERRNGAGRAGDRRRATRRRPTPRGRGEEGPRRAGGAAASPALPRVGMSTVCLFFSSWGATACRGACGDGGAPRVGGATTVASAAAGRGGGQRGRRATAGVAARPPPAAATLHAAARRRGGASAAALCRAAPPPPPAEPCAPRSREQTHPL